MLKPGPFGSGPTGVLPGADEAGKMRAIAVGTVLALVFSAMPHDVLAASFTSTVTFPTDPSPELVATDGAEGGDGSFFESCGNLTRTTSQAAAGSWSYQLSSGDPLCRVRTDIAIPIEGVEYEFQWFGGDFGGAGSQRQTWGFCDSSQAFIGSFDYQVLPDGGWSGQGRTETAPAGAAYFCMKGDSDHNTYMDIIIINGATTDSAGCIGEGELAWGAAGLTTGHPWYGDGGRYAYLEPAGWGDHHDGAHDACLVSFGTPSFEYQFPSVPTLGDTFRFLSYFWCVDDITQCAVEYWWIGEFGGLIDDPVTGGAIHRYEVDDRGLLSGEGYFGYSWFSDAPGDATGVLIQVAKGTAQVLHQVANEEGGPGDPDDPGFTCTTDMPQCDGGNYSGNLPTCLTPEDPLNVAGWVEWLGCMVQNGFARILAAIGHIVDDVFASLSAVLEDLFVPTEVGTAWDDFLDLFASKVPMVWVSEVIDFLSGMLTAGNLQGASIPTSMTLLGAPVSLDFSAVFSPLTPYRFVLVGLVYIAGAWAIFRAVGRAMGMGGGDG